MPLKNCKEPGCNQEVNVSCQKVVFLMRTKIFLESVKKQLPASSDLQEETTQQLKSVNEKISALKLKEEGTLLFTIKNNKTIMSLAEVSSQPVVLTLTCVKGHQYNYETECP